MIGLRGERRRARARADRGGRAASRSSRTRVPATDDAKVAPGRCARRRGPLRARAPSPTSSRRAPPGRGWRRFVAGTSVAAARVAAAAARRCAARGRTRSPPRSPRACRGPRARAATPLAAGAGEPRRRGGARRGTVVARAGRRRIAAPGRGRSRSPPRADRRGRATPARKPLRLTPSAELPGLRVTHRRPSTLGDPARRDALDVEAHRLRDAARAGRRGTCSRPAARGHAPAPCSSLPVGPPPPAPLVGAHADRARRAGRPACASPPARCARRAAMLAGGAARRADARDRSTRTAGACATSRRRAARRTCCRASTPTR